MIHDELYRAKRIRACETELLKLYITCHDPRAFSAITDLIDAAMNEGALSERYKHFNDSRSGPGDPNGQVCDPNGQVW
jgi:hypothetical protein